MKITKQLKKRLWRIFYFLIKNHCFVDGNKRTGVLCFKMLCNRNKMKISIPDSELDEIAIFLEKTSDNHQKVIKTVSDFLFKNN